MYKSILLFIYLFLLGSSLYAEETIAKGKVVDAESGEPLPYVNIVFDNTVIGTVSDSLGVYFLQTSTSVDSIRFIVMGYHPVSYKVLENNINNIDVFLIPNIIALDEITAKPDNSEARRLMEQVIKNKTRNNPENLESYAYRRYSQWKYQLNNVSDQIKQWRIFKNKDLLFQNAEDGSTILPLYKSEQVVLNEFQNEPLLRKSTIEGDLTSGPGLLEDTEISGFTSGLESGINFYENSIEIMGSNFINPTSNNSLFYYNFYLLDSINYADSKHYIIRFRPKRKGDNVFTGQLTIENNFFSIVEIDAELTNTQHLNFIREFKLSAKYKLIADSIPFYASTEIVAVIDYMPIELAKNQQRLELMVVNFMSYGDVEAPLKKNIQLSHKSLSYESLKQDAYRRRDEAYWKSMRPNMLEYDNSDFEKSIDQLNDLPFIQFLNRLGEMFITGYFDLGKWELGPYDYMLNFNNVEGTHLFLGGRVGDSYFKNFNVWGGIGYGTRNKKWLGRLGGGYKLPAARRTIFQVEYTNDIVLIGENEKILFLYENKQHTSESNLISYIFKRAELDELHQREQIRLSFEKEVRSGLRVRTNISATRFHSPEFYPFVKDNKPISYFNAEELSVNLRWSWNEKYVDYDYRRFYLGTPKPILNLYVAGGNSSVDSENKYYARVHSSLKHYFFIGQTRVDYALESGTILGVVPYPLLDIPRANITYGFQKYNFNMMENLEFIHDKYVHTFIEYRLNGFIFKRTPFIKKLGLREVVSIKSSVGDVGFKHHQLLNFPQTDLSYNNKLYTETGIGVENILRFFRVDAIWRFTPSNESPLFGVRGRMEIKF